MAASVFDSPLYAQLFPTGEVGRLFTDSAAIRAMLLVEGALAKVQGAAGVIPEISAAAIHRATLEVQIDPGALAQSTGQNGVSVPGLVAAFRAEMNMPEHAQYLHWGATSQDIIDTGMMLRLRQALGLIEADVKALLGVLATQAVEHAETPMAARTYGQIATPTTWGAVIAQWGAPLLDKLDKLEALRCDSLWVSLSGAAGTGSELGDDPAALRAALAEALNLTDPQRTWHTDRGPILRIADWLGGICAPLGAMGETVIALSAGGINEVAWDAAGASSTMPQKQNPVAASAVVALARQTAALRAGLGDAAIHQHQRDGAAWFTEWMVMPQLVLSAASCVQQALALARNLRPQPEAMLTGLRQSHETIFAEALSFELARRMPRPEAQAEVKRLCAEALSTATPLSDLARATFADLPDTLFDPAAQLGQAPTEARAFAARVRAAG